MKKYEKVLLTLFGGCEVLSVSVFLYIWFGLEKGFGYFDDEMMIVPFWAVFLSLCGIVAVLVSWRLRKRAEAGMKPISKLYTASFIMSFIPFVVILIKSMSVSEFTFMGSVVATGAEAVWDTFFWTGILLFSMIIPLLPAMIFWQILYIIKRIKYRKRKTAITGG